jgi:hypothetical protein
VFSFQRAARPFRLPFPVAKRRLPTGNALTVPTVPAVCFQRLTADSVASFPPSVPFWCPVLSKRYTFQPNYTFGQTFASLSRFFSLPASSSTLRQFVEPAPTSPRIRPVWDVSAMQLSANLGSLSSLLVC